MGPSFYSRLSAGVVGVVLCLAGGHLGPLSGQSVALDVPYVADGLHKQQLDLYTPDSPGYPTLLFVHEGGLTSGDRKDQPYAEMCGAFVELGIGCAAASYRLAPQAKWPAQPEDVASAFAWLEANLAARGGDPDRVFLFGHSSGCLLVSLVGADPGYLTRHGLTQGDVAGIVAMGCRLDDRVEVGGEGPTGYERSWLRPDGVPAFLASEGAFETLQARNDAVPSRHVSADLPPTLVVVAEDERFFPPILRDGAEFVGRALSQGATADLVVLPERRHMTAIQMMVTTADPGVQLVADFVRAN